MSRTVTALYRYPIKGLSAEALPFVDLQPGCTFPHDRRFAIVHRNSKFDHEHPAWIARRNFTVLAYSPPIARLATRCDAHSRSIKFSCGAQSWLIGIDDDDADERLNQVLQYLNIDSQPGPYRFVEVDSVSLTDSPEPLISLMNTRSLGDLQSKTGVTLESTRFRGNLWFEGEQAWEERQWLGQELSLGNLRVRVVEEIVRCSAIDVNPARGERDMSLLKRLGGIYGHTRFGVLAEVLQPGRLSVGDVVEESQTRSLGLLGI